MKRSIRSDIMHRGIRSACVLCTYASACFICFYGIQNVPPLIFIFLHALYHLSILQSVSSVPSNSARNLKPVKQQGQFSGGIGFDWSANSNIHSRFLAADKLMDVWAGLFSHLLPTQTSTTTVNHSLFLRYDWPLYYSFITFFAVC